MSEVKICKVSDGSIIAIGVSEDGSEVTIDGVRYVRAAPRSHCTCSHATVHRTNPNCPLHGKPLRSDSPVNKQDREHDMDLAYANGWCDREEGGIEVEASGPVDGRGKRYIVTLAEPPDEALRGPYVLLPRQVEGDDNPRKEG